MLVSLDLDESTEDEVVAVYDVAGTLIRIKSKPAVARGAGEDDGDGGDAGGGGDGAEASATAPSAPLPTQAKYLNVGLVLWQAGLVAADWIIRHRMRPPASTDDDGATAGTTAPSPLTVIELGAGVGQCGIALAKAGAARVVMTDLPHIVPLAEENARLNGFTSSPSSSLACVPYTWGDDAAPVLEALRRGGEGATQWPDLVVAADCLYEPRVYPVLLQAIGSVSGPHTRVVLCHRLRVYDEKGFEEAAAAEAGGGWEVRAAPNEELHADYACGGWRLVEMTRRGGEVG
jgi:predicted nicotinamide N-methyase